MVYNNKSGWTVSFVDRRAVKEVEKLAKDVRAHLERTVAMIETYGLDEVHEPYVKHVTGKLWEIRAKGRDGIARALYVAAVGKRVIILHAFVKKTQQTPHEAIELALKQAKEHGFL